MNREAWRTIVHGVPKSQIHLRDFTLSLRTILCAVLCLVAQSCLTLCDPMDCSPPHSSVHGDSPGKNTGVGYHTLLQGIFPTQGSNPGLPHCRWILYQLSHKGSQEYWSGQPIPSPANIPDPGIEPGSPALQVGSLPTELSSGKPTQIVLSYIDR